MSQPFAGQPYFASPGFRLSVGDFGAADGTDAHKGVVVLDNDIPSSNVVDRSFPFGLKAYFQVVLGIGYALPNDFKVEFHIRNLAGDPVVGSPFSGGNPVSPDIPTGASAPAALLDIATWSSSSVNIPVSTLNADETYRVTVEGKAPNIPPGVYAFHDLTIIHARP